MERASKLAKHSENDPKPPCSWYNALLYGLFSEIQNLYNSGMNDCRHRYQTGLENTLICQDCGEVFTPDPKVVKHFNQRPKKPLPKKAISYWYLVPVRIKFHYHTDGEESFIDTVLDIPMTEPFISDLKKAEIERSTSQKKILEESLDVLLENVTRELRNTLPPGLQQDCTITVKITGPISYSKTPLD